MKQNLLVKNSMEIGNNVGKMLNFASCLPEEPTKVVKVRFIQINETFGWDEAEVML